MLAVHWMKSGKLIGITRHLPALVLLPSLSGCWVSEQPLFAASDFAHPLAQGRYSACDSKLCDPKPATLRALPSGFYELTRRQPGEDSDAVHQFALAPLTGAARENSFVAMAYDASDKRWTYMLIEIRGPAVAEFDPADCPDALAPTRGAGDVLGAAVADCIFPDRASLLRAMTGFSREADGAAPDMTYTRQ